MTTIPRADLRDQIAALLKDHYWWMVGNRGVPGMPDYVSYKCDCGWQGDEPREHVAEALLSGFWIQERVVVVEDPTFELPWVDG